MRDFRLIDFQDVGDAGLREAAGSNGLRDADHKSNGKEDREILRFMAARPEKRDAGKSSPPLRSE